MMTTARDLDLVPGGRKRSGGEPSRTASCLSYVMPFVEGESLREELNRERQLPVDVANDISKVLASALDFAHKRGVVHRDIKPEDILFQEDVKLIADFGIAVALNMVGGDRPRIAPSEAGFTVGASPIRSPSDCGLAGG